MPPVLSEAGPGVSPEHTGVLYARLGIGYFTLNSQGEITTANSVFGKMVGIPEEAAGAQVPVALMDALETQEGKSQFASHYSSLRPDQPTAVDYFEISPCQFMQVQSRAVFDDDGKPLSYETSTFDVTDAVLPLTRQVALLTRERDEAVEAAETMAHDLKGPVSRTKGYLGLIRILLEDVQGIPGAVTQQLAKMGEYLHSADRGADTASKIMDETMEIVRLSQASVEPASVDMDQVLASLRMHVSVAKAKKDVQVSLPEAMPNPLGRDSWVERIWDNLLSNAIKYGGDSIEIGAAPLFDGRIRYWVKDNGPGIPPEAREKIFQKFVRLKREYPRAEGTGLGLAIIKTMVEKMGGEVGVESEEGKGSTFFFILPAAAPQSVEPLPDLSP